MIAATIMTHAAIMTGQNQDSDVMPPLEGAGVTDGGYPLDGPFDVVPQILIRLFTTFEPVLS